MRELRDIVSAYKKAQAEGIACALATVVHVEGSSYRRPGARMLVTQHGQLTGAISGGCLEGDALRKALLAISEGHNKLVTYDTTDEDDAKLGIQLGCNGIVHILFEPIDSTGNHHPIALIEKIIEQRQPAVLSTLFSLEDKQLEPGTCLLYNGSEFFKEAEKQSGALPHPTSIQEEVRLVWTNRSSVIRQYQDQRLVAFHQFIAPPLSLIIGGAGNDVMPLIAIAAMMGWETTLADGRPTHANTIRFPLAHKIVITKPEAILQHVAIDDETVCVLMSHNYNYDLAMLRQMLRSPARYIGILGPKTKLERMHADLEKESIDISDKSRIFSPVGLDIGAETPDEIALSIAAEIQCVLMGKNANMLRSKLSPVHS